MKVEGRMLNPPPTGQVADTSRFEIQDTADGIFATLVINSAIHRHFRRKAKFVPVYLLYTTFGRRTFSITIIRIIIQAGKDKPD